MAVERVPSEEIAEAEEQPLIVARFETRHVLAALLYQRRGGRRLPVDGERLELLEVHVDRMVPARSLVLPIPYLDGISLHSEADVVAGEDLVVNPPVAAVLESEIARDPWRSGRGRETVERADGGRILADVAHHGTVDEDLQQQVALPRRKQPTARPLSVVLHQ